MQRGMSLDITSRVTKLAKMIEPKKNTHWAVCGRVNEILSDKSRHNNAT